MTAEVTRPIADSNQPAVAPGHLDASNDARRYDIELLRIIASISVVFLHTSGLLLLADIKNPNGGAAHWIALTGDTLGRFAVPAFFAISGWAVLAASPPRSGGILMRRVVRVVVPLGVWTAIYLLWSMLLPGGVQRPTGRLAVEALFGSIRPAFHLWYLYAYIPLLLLLGCVGLVRSGRSFRLPGMVLLVLAVLPTVAAPVAVLTGVDLPKSQWGPAFYQVVYAVGGALLLSRPRRGRLLVLIPCTLAGFLAVLWWEHTVQFPSPYGTLAVAVYTASTILLITVIRVPDRARSLIRRLADASFGVYLIHLLLLQAILTWVVGPNAAHRSPAVSLVAVAGTVVVASFILSLLWGKLGLRKFLG